MRKFLPFLVALGACGGSNDGDRVWSNEGQVCLAPVPTGTTGSTTSPPTGTTATATTTLPEPVVFGATDELRLEVTFGGCDCGEELTTKLCGATREGDTWTVSSEARSPAGGCEPCEPIVAVCPVGVVGEGTFTFEHGGDLLIVSVPGEVASPCAGEPTEGTPE